MNSLESENRRLRDELQRLKREARNNESILRRAQARELRLLEAESLGQLLARMTGFLAESFDLARVGVVLVDPQRELRHLLLATVPGEPLPPGVTFTRGFEAPLAGLRQPWLGPYIADRHRILFASQGGAGRRRGGVAARPAEEAHGADRGLVRSVALLPLMRERRLAGLMCLGATESNRFTRNLATDFLRHFAVIASFALDNAINRARLVLSGLTDPLTGCHNRRYLEDRMGEELARAQRDRNSLTCLMLDIDYFKRVNDEYGHQAGDSVLRETAQRVQQRVRGSDVVARYGGEEFAVLLPATGVEDGVALADRIRRSVCAAPVTIDYTRAVTVTISVGVGSCLPMPGDSLDALGEQLLASADAALYEAKAAGRDRVCRVA